MLFTNDRSKSEQHLTLQSTIGNFEVAQQVDDQSHVIDAILQSQQTRITYARQNRTFTIQQGLKRTCFAISQNALVLRTVYWRSHLVGIIDLRNMKV